MHFSTRSTVGALSAALLAPLASAQTPSGFSPSVSGQLSVTYGAKAVSPAGLTLTKEETASIPSIASGSGALTGSKFLFMMIDLDVPVKSGGTITGRQTLLHALVGNFTAGADGKLTTTTANAAPATYIGPSPPAENPAKPHRYTQLLFEQPDNFAIPSSQAAAIQKRTGFDAAAFISAANLKAPIQGNFFLVVNSQVGAAAESSATGKAEATASASGKAEGGKSGESSKTAEGGKGGESSKTAEGGKGGEASKTAEGGGRAASTGALPTRTASGTGNRSGAAGATGSGAAKGTGAGSAKSTGAARGTGTGAAGSRTTAPLNPAMFTGAADMNNVKNRFGAVVAAGALIFAL